MRNHSPIRILIALVACTISIGSSFADEPLKKPGQKSENELRAVAELQCKNGQIEDLLKTCENLIRLVESRDSVESTCEIEDFIAVLLIQANQLEASVQHAKRSWGLSQSHFGKDHWQTVSRHWSLSYVQKLQAAPNETVRQMLKIESRYNDFLASQKYAEAANEIEKLVPFERKILGARHPFIANTWANQADCWISAENYGAAKNSATNAFAIRHKELGAKHPDTATAAWILAKALIHHEKHEAALEYLELAAKVWRATGNLVDAAWMDSSRGDSLAALDRPSDAASAYKYAAAQFTALKEHANAGYTHTELALLLQKQNKPFKAAEEFRLAASEHDRAGTPLEPFTCLLRSAELFIEERRYDDAVRAISDSSKHAGLAAKTMSENDVLEELTSVISKILPLFAEDLVVVEGLEAWSKLTENIGSEETIAAASADALLSMKLRLPKSSTVFKAQTEWREASVRRWENASRIHAVFIQEHKARILTQGRESKFSSAKDCSEAYQELLALGDIPEGDVNDEFKRFRASTIVDAAKAIESHERGAGLELLNRHSDLLLEQLSGKLAWQMHKLRYQWLKNANRTNEATQALIEATAALESAKVVTDVEIRNSLAALVLALMEANGEASIDDAEKRARRRLILHLAKMGDSASQFSELVSLRLRLEQGGLKHDAEQALKEVFSLARSMNSRDSSTAELFVAIQTLDVVAGELEGSGLLGPADFSCKLALELSQNLPESEAVGFRVGLLGKQLTIAISGGQSERVNRLSANLRRVYPFYLERLSKLAEVVPEFEFVTKNRHNNIVVMSYLTNAQYLLHKPIVDDITVAVSHATELDAKLEQISDLLRKQEDLDEFFARNVQNSRVLVWGQIENRLIGDQPEILSNDARAYVASMKANAIKIFAPDEPDANLWDSVALVMQLFAKIQMLSDEERQNEDIVNPLLREGSAIANNLRQQPMVYERDAGVQILLGCAFADWADGNYESVVKTCYEAADMLEQLVVRTGGPPQEIIARSQKLRTGLDPYTFGLWASVLNDDLNTAFKFAARGRSLGSRIAWQRTRNLSITLASKSRPAWLPAEGRLTLEEQYSAFTSADSAPQGRTIESIGDQISSALKPDERYILISTLHGKLAGPDHELPNDVGLFFIRPKTHPELGIQFFERGIDSAVANDSVPTEGVYVINVVTGSAAFQIGIRPGDIIQKLDGTGVTPESFPEELQKTSSEQDIEFMIYRDGEVIELIRPKPAKSLGVLFSKTSPREAERRSRQITSPELAEARTLQVASLSNRGWSTRSSRSAKLIENDDSPLLSAKGESWRLFKSLFPADVWEELKSVRKVYLSVPGQLAGLPLETLVVESPAGNSSEKDTVRWIDVGPQVVYLPFASLIPVDEDAEVQPTKLAYLGIGDVDFTSVDGVELPRLPNTRREVESISQVFKNEPAKVLLGADASEESLFNIAPEARIISIATHGQYKDGLDTLETSVVLGATTTRGNSEIPEQRRNGKLTLRDLLTDWRGRLPATELTILSACQTGGGLVTQEDGTVGLPFGFLAAGSDAVIASQWPVDDARTADLFSEMFSNRGNEEDMLSAFTRARRKLRAQHPDPHYWAPFIYISSH